MQGLWCHCAKNIGQEKVSMGFLQTSNRHCCNTTMGGKKKKKGIRRREKERKWCRNGVAQSWKEVGVLTFLLSAHCAEIDTLFHHSTVQFLNCNVEYNLSSISSLSGHTFLMAHSHTTKFGLKLPGGNSQWRSNHQRSQPWDGRAFKDNYLYEKSEVLPAEGKRGTEENHRNTPVDVKTFHLSLLICVSQNVEGEPSGNWRKELTLLIYWSCLTVSGILYHWILKSHPNSR